eukprot:TRINITY_DN9664_c0_g1_i7.p1 TRINITY_DN9664_c0_g1~~TRINITY_DN9664_c0_g1_i7.p1  ORF type:complete len:442 (-),score=79.84 TRINITY_DN9664_c0_g1_i7:109-1434(-)
MREEDLIQRQGALNYSHYKNHNTAPAQKSKNNDFIVRIKHGDADNIPEYSDASKRNSQVPCLASFNSSRDPHIGTYKEEFQYAPDGTLYYNTMRKDFFMLSFGPANEKVEAKGKGNRVQTCGRRGDRKSNRDVKRVHDPMNATGIPIMLALPNKDDSKPVQRNVHPRKCERFCNNWRRQEDDYSREITQNFLAKVVKSDKGKNVSVEIPKKDIQETGPTLFQYHSYLKHKASIENAFKNYNTAVKTKAQSMPKKPAINQVQHVVSLKANASPIIERKREIRLVNDATAAQVLTDKYESLYKNYDINSKNKSAKPAKTKRISPFNDFITAVRNKQKVSYKHKKAQIESASLRYSKVQEAEKKSKFVIGAEVLPMSIHKQSKVNRLSVEYGDESLVSQTALEELRKVVKESFKELSVGSKVKMMAGYDKNTSEYKAFLYGNLG